MNIPTRLDDLRGSEHVKRAIEVALTGFHTIALYSTSNPLDMRAFALWLGRAGLTVYELTHCPCGNLGSADIACTCTAAETYQHQRGGEYAFAQIHADIHIEVVAIPYEKLTGRKGESDERIIERVERARKVSVTLDLDSTCLSLMKAAYRQLAMGSSVRYDSIIALAGTIAKMDGEKSIKATYLAEALQYRPRRCEPSKPKEKTEDYLDEIAGYLKRLAENAEERYK